MATDTMTRSTEAALAVPAGAVDIGKGFHLVTAEPLSYLDGPTAKAYRVVSAAQPSRMLYAVACGRVRAPRIDLLNGFRNAEYSMMVSLVDFTIGPFPQTNEEMLYLVFDRPIGRPMMTSLTETFVPWPEDRIVQRVLQPMFQMIRDMNGSGLAHGRISLTNLFASDATGAAMVLGECLSAPPGMGQPILFEPIDRALCDPAGRGPASTEDDLYALGIVCALLLLGRNPLAERSGDQVIAIKSDQGTYPSLFKRMRVHSNLVEPLRGLLQDSRSSRWSMRDLDLWLNGRRLSPKQPDPVHRAARPFRFQGEDLWHPRAMARAFAQAEAGAFREISSGHVDLWLRRALQAPRIAERLEEALTAVNARGRSAQFESLAVSRALMALDPSAPIRYRGVTVHPGGISYLLAESLAERTNTEALTELIGLNLAATWFNAQGGLTHENSALLRELDRAKAVLDKAYLGFGVERALYELNGNAPCQSPILKGLYVYTLRALVIALETVAKRPDRPARPIDRHIAAFIAAREKQADEWIFKEISDDRDKEKQIIGTVRLMSMIVRHHPTRRVPALTAWCREVGAPLLDHYRNKRTRERIERDVNKALEEGDLPRLFRLMSDPVARIQDKAQFERARQAHFIMEREIERLQREIDDPRGATRDYGRYYAVIVSLVISTFTTGTIVLFMGAFA